MPRPYSLDLRQRVASGGSVREVAATFDVSVASMVKWSQRYRTLGSTAARRMGGHRKNKLESERAWLLARIAERPDITLQALLDELRRRSVPASYGSVWRLLDAAGISFKNLWPVGDPPGCTESADP